MRNEFWQRSLSQFFRMFPFDPLMFSEGSKGNIGKKLVKMIVQKMKLAGFFCGNVSHDLRQKKNTEFDQSEILM